ncbi:MoxR family ATPase [Oscillospiraceae bacterium OttesenSCG-928-G22]|nr:MoxR family ATPase [Oscillospiraceae bacterium OttesenSCG-928-G22]
MDIGQKLSAIASNMGKILVGKAESLELVLAALFARGHVLIEDVPGIGKTTLVSALAASLSLSFQRIQFTPDVMPSDIVGFSVYDRTEGKLRYQPGAVLHQMVLADEINRASPKTQSSLLEVMQESQVTVDGHTYAVPLPFIVLATQNPVEHVGTFPLPEAQLDRFLLRVSLGYPGIREEIDILNLHDGPSPEAKSLSPVLSAEEVQTLQAVTDAVVCSEAIKEYIALIAGQTRSNPDILLGASPRAAVALMRASKAYALIKGREYVLPDDVIHMAIPVLAHRLMLKPEARLTDTSTERIIKTILQTTRIPESA